MIMVEMEKHLPESIYVIDQTGSISESNATTVVQGGWNQKFDFWNLFAISGSPDLISVPADSPFNKLQELVDAPKAKPGSIPAAASEALSIGYVVFPTRQS